MEQAHQELQPSGLTNIQETLIFVYPTPESSPSAAEGREIGSEMLFDVEDFNGSITD